MITTGCRKRSCGGLTLVEVVVTLGVLAVIMAFVLPTVRSAWRRADEVRCQANLRQIALYMTAYAKDYDGRFPLNVTAPSPGKYWFDRPRIGPYVSASTVLPSGLSGGGFLACAADVGGQRSYAMNLWASAAVDGDRLQRTPPRGRLFRFGNHHSSRLILLTETWSSTESDQLGWFAPATVGFLGETPAQRFGAAGGVTPFLAGRWSVVNCEVAYSRHRDRGGTGTQPIGRVNIAFADGHVEMKSNDDLVDHITGEPTRDALWSELDVAQSATRLAQQ